MILDGTHYFKYAAISALSNDKLLDVFHAIKTGNQSQVANFVIDINDMEYVAEVLRERVYDGRSAC